MDSLGSPTRRGYPHTRTRRAHGRSSRPRVRRELAVDPNSDEDVRSRLSDSDALSFAGGSYIPPRFGGPDVAEALDDPGGEYHLDEGPATGAN